VDLTPLVQKGRETFLDQFPSIAQSGTAIPSIHDRATFEASRLQYSEREQNAHILALHRDLIRLRRTDPVFSAQRADWMHGAVLGPEAFALRYFGGVHGDRLVVVNLGRDLDLTPVPEPLLAPPSNQDWGVLWSSESATYGAAGRIPVDKDGIWSLTGESAVVLCSKHNPLMN
jgi:maltooligosyltrehalose trehalohydrolase